MSLVAVYRALEESGASKESASAAVEAIEQRASGGAEWHELREWRSEMDKWRAKTDQRLTRLEVMLGVTVILLVAAVGRLYFG